MILDKVGQPIDNMINSSSSHTHNTVPFVLEQEKIDRKDLFMSFLVTMFMVACAILFVNAAKTGRENAYQAGYKAGQEDILGK